MLKRALDAYGQLDAVIANAGITENRMFRNQSLDDFKRVIDINLLGTANVLHPTFRFMCEQGRGNIVIVSSTAGSSAASVYPPTPLRKLP